MSQLMIFLNVQDIGKMKIQFESGGLFFIIFLVLLVLKLCSVITISWWIVTLPLWGPFCIALAIGIFMLAIAVIKIWGKL